MTGPSNQHETQGADLAEVAGGNIPEQNLTDRKSRSPVRPSLGRFIRFCLFLLSSVN